ncbi:MAG: RNA polymerase sigma factor [Planctomycetota bacterium]
MASDSDRALLAAYADGGASASDAFEELVRRHGGMVCATCSRVLGDAVAAEDAAQAVFVALARKARSIRGEPGSWLHTVAVNAARQAVKSELARKRREKEAAGLSCEMRSRRAPEAGWEKVRPHLDDAIQRLPAAERAAVLLYYLEGRPRTGVAEQLGVAEGTVASRLHRAVGRMRKYLERRGAGMPAAVLTGILAERGAETACPAFLLAAAGALAVAGESAGAAAIPGSVALLAKGVLKTMFWAKVKAAAGVLGICLAAGASIPIAVGAAGAGETTVVETPVAVGGSGSEAIPGPQEEEADGRDRPAAERPAKRPPERPVEPIAESSVDLAGAGPKDRVLVAAKRFTMDGTPKVRWPNLQHLMGRGFSYGLVGDGKQWGAFYAELRPAFKSLRRSGKPPEADPDSEVLIYALVNHPGPAKIEVSRTSESVDLLIIETPLPGGIPGVGSHEHIFVLALAKEDTGEITFRKRLPRGEPVVLCQLQRRDEEWARVKLPKPLLGPRQKARDLCAAAREAVGKMTVAWRAGRPAAALEMCARMRKDLALAVQLDPSAKRNADPVLRKLDQLEPHVKADLKAQAGQ